MTASDLGHIVTDYINSKGDTVSPKKLQKLLFYIEAWNMVHLGTPIIEEDFEAWVHGPVLPSLYRELKAFGFNNLKVINDELDSAQERIDRMAKKNNLSEDQMDLIESVLNKYGHLSSFELEMLTHNEDPWIEARGTTPPHIRCTNVIPKERMRAYYAAQLQEI